MLLVARRVGEALRIGTNIEVKVVAATRSRVMLAVTAPRELSIRRIYGKSDYKNLNLDEPEDSLSDAPATASAPGAGVLAEAQPEDDTGSTSHPTKKQLTDE